uniref:Uncharacterized protein n=1 Tax=Lotus japonicus TaxID=34305 RepID=I3SG34_LOTJA|nr:unknown [Lotus japonicus]
MNTGAMGERRKNNKIMKKAWRAPRSSFHLQRNEKKEQKRSFATGVGWG